MTERTICVKCVMDTSDPDIRFDARGVCNHCLTAEKNLPQYRFTKQEEEANLQRLKRQILERRRGDYDCLIGVSGGVDSSYVAYLAVKRMGLKPLAVHMDNGWNTETAVANINNLVNSLGIDLETYVIDWEEFRDLQCAFIRAGVVDVELLTDQAHKAVSARMARKYNIRTALTGGNYVTEHGMPKSWYWSIKQDVTNIRAIYRKFPGKPLRTYPFLNTIRHKFVQKTGIGMLSLPVLNYINYDKSSVLEVLKNELGWADYGGKHNESLWTKFYQEYYLPKRFGIDKRKVHYSALIRTGSISREQALEWLERDTLSASEQEEFVEYVIKKLGFTPSGFEALMREPRVEHDAYPSQKRILEQLHLWKQRVQV